MLPDGNIDPGSMTSFNRYAFGAVANWLHQTVGGVESMVPGWKAIKVKPVPGGNITGTEVAFDGPFGWAKCEWLLEGITSEWKSRYRPTQRHLSFFRQRGRQRTN
ncbi:bacterial alpha-L-rhamnosidase-domain-containing protein [Dactylonectria macrodidyma]|uniref:Bacterial alpha-L-rhamnosidase-domain-containing protein n=1 Tax=Dactylonectria macrodidyma TaxID=307937 RepID=A0A9P9EVK2_9HYPO|nr:bacterial alpha-L-rhamnosidase-domain-containing protein [Dactylonectria macrodidyma]